jgi:hypothetical protein
MSDQQMKDLARIFARKISDVRIEQPINDPEFTYLGNSIEPTVISTQTALEPVVEQQIDVHLGGLDLLFTKNKIATSTNEWAQLVHSHMETAYVLEGLDLAAVHDAVRTAKDKHRARMLSNMANNLIYATTDVQPYSVKNLKELLQEGGAYLEKDDDEVLDKIFKRTIGQADDYRAGWIEEAGQITRFPSGRDDLVTLIDECSGNLYSTQIGTVVGGIAVKGNVKKVAGLTDATARIDRQNPPPGAFNVQFQIGGQSHACVIFDQSDPQEIVLEKLLASFDSGMQLRSPRVKS